MLGASLGLAALFLYLDASASSTTGATNSILFGSLFTADPSSLPVVTVLGAATVVVIAALYRPLLLSSVDYDLAAVRGLRVRLIGVAYLLTLNPDRVRQRRLVLEPTGFARELLHRMRCVCLLCAGVSAGPLSIFPDGSESTNPHSDDTLMFADFMINAWQAATIVAVVAGVVGFFTVLRGSAFAAHSLPNGAFAGAAGV